MIKFNIYFSENANGGPVTWIHQNYRCENCYDPRLSNNKCCVNVTSGALCHADSDTIETDYFSVSIMYKQY